MGDFFEEQPVGVGFDGPCTHGQTELDIGLDLASVGGAVEQPELHGALGEVGVEVDAVVPGGVVVLVIDATCVVVVCPGVPGGFHVAIGADGVLHRSEEIGRHFVAPTVGTCTNLKRFVEQILSAGGEVDQSGQALGGVLLAVHMDVNTAGAVGDGTGFPESPDDVLEIFQIFVLEDRGDQFTGMIMTCAHRAAVLLALSADGCVGHGLPCAVLTITGAPGLVVGTEVMGGGAEVVGDNGCCLLACDAGEFDFYAEVLVFIYTPKDLAKVADFVGGQLAIIMPDGQIITLECGEDPDEGK